MLTSTKDYILLWSVTIGLLISIVLFAYRIEYTKKIYYKIVKLDQKKILLPSFCFLTLPFILPIISNFIFYLSNVLNNCMIQLNMTNLIIEIIRTSCLVGTFIIAFISYKKFINNKLLEKQLEKVLYLIKLISDYQFLVSFYTSPDLRQDLEKMGLSHYISNSNISIFEKTTKTNLFSLNIEIKNQLFDEIYITDQVMIKFNEIAKFSKDPLIPRSIAEILAKFFIFDDDLIVAGLDISNGYKIGDIVIKNIEETPEIKPVNISKSQNENTGIAWKSWENFISCSNELHLTIKKWMSQNGITEINL